MRWLKRKVRAWLGVADDWTATCQAVRGLRTDHEATVKAFHDWRQMQSGIDQQVVQQLNTTTRAAASLDQRLGYYERTVAPLVRARKAFDAAVAKERRKAEREAKKMALVANEPDSPESPDPIETQREAHAEVADG